MISHVLDVDGRQVSCDQGWPIDAARCVFVAINPYYVVYTYRHFHEKTDVKLDADSRSQLKVEA